MGIDAVITYVNMEDPIWMEGYRKNVGDLNQGKIVNNVSRFRDYGGLKACLRSIEMYAPWIENIYLVVQSESQVPAWINREEVKVVLHADFIPEEVLPTYSAFSIEVFLHLIPGISEQFLYFNDDMILTRPVVKEEFFLEKVPVHCLKSSVHTVTVTDGDYQCKEIACDDFMVPIKNAWKMAMKASGCNCSQVMMSDHGVYSFTKTINEECYNKIKDDLIASCTKVRSHKSVICWMYLYYAYLTNRLIVVGPRTKEVHFTEGELYHVVSSIFNTTWQCVCINDRNISNYNLAKELTQDALFTRFNTPSKYENC